MVILDSVCKACVQSREVEQFLDFYDTETKMTLLRLAEYEDDDFSDGLKQRCYYKVKLNGASHLHTVWLPFQQAVESTKFNAFYRKLASWHSELNSVSSLVDNLECQLRSQTSFWPQPESILSLLHKEKTSNGSPTPMIRAADWKYCLVKWQGLEHDQMTWELTSEIHRIFRDASTSSLFGEFEMRVRSQFCAQHDTKYRLSLMRSRRHALRDPEGQAVPVTLAVEKANSNLRLLDHQKKGVHWLLEAWRQSRNVMLADEMGLGKTI